MAKKHLALKMPLVPEMRFFVCCLGDQGMLCDRLVQISGAAFHKANLIHKRKTSELVLLPLVFLFHYPLPSREVSFVVDASFSVIIVGFVRVICADAFSPARVPVFGQIRHVLLKKRSLWEDVYIRLNINQFLCKSGHSTVLMQNFLK